MAVASLVLGIIALVCVFFGYGAWLGLILGIVAIILAAQAKKTEPSNGVATGGLVCGIIAVILDAIVAISCTLCVGCAACAACSGFGFLF